jgi:maltose phosphorylase
LQFALEVDAKFDALPSQLKSEEKKAWQHLIDHVYFPKMNDSNIFLQQDNFLDKELLNATDIPENERPINQHWSWDRILRSVFIKQADVLQGIYLFEDHFSNEEIEDNFNFYEPKTVHESSLSPCIHSILAAKIGDKERAYKLYLRTSRLDLDDYNHEVAEGLHITSMAGTWMSIVEGMAGISVQEYGLSMNPIIPSEWKSYSFNIFFQNQPLRIAVSNSEVTILNNGSNTLELNLYGESHRIPAKGNISTSIQ